MTWLNWINQDWADSIRVCLANTLIRAIWVLTRLLNWVAPAKNFNRYFTLMEHGKGWSGLDYARLGVRGKRASERI